MDKRQQAFEKLIESGQMQRLTQEERQEAAQQAARSVVSAVEYLDYHQKLQERGSKTTLAELLPVARELEADEAEAAKPQGEPLLIASDRDSLLQSLKRRLPDTLSGATTWKQVVEKLQAAIQAADPPPTTDTAKPPAPAPAHAAPATTAETPKPPAPAPAHAAPATTAEAPKPTIIT